MKSLQKLCAFKCVVELYHQDLLKNCESTDRTLLQKFLKKTPKKCTDHLLLAESPDQYANIVRRELHV